MIGKAHTFQDTNTEASKVHNELPSNGPILKRSTERTEKKVFTNDLAWLSNTRAITTLSVVILHVAAPLLYLYGKIPNEHWLIANFYDSAVRFCVPVFFMISGSLLLGKDDSLKIFLRKRFFKILPPFLFWSLIYIVFDALIKDKSLLAFEFYKEGIRKLLHGSEYHLWFVYAILGIYLFVPFMRKWTKYSTKNEVIYFLVIWSCTLLYTIPFFDAILPNLYLVYFSGYAGFFIMGYFLSQVTLKTKRFPLLLIILGIAMTFFGTSYLTYKGDAFNDFFYDYLRPNVVISAIGFFLLLKNISIENYLLKRTIKVINENSYGIYLSHVLVLFLLNIIGINWELTHPFFSIPITTIACLLISGALIFLIRKNRYGKYIAG